MSYELIEEQTVKARKRHCCIACGEPILPGDSYVRNKSVYEGGFQNHAWHSECKDGFDREFQQTGEETIYPGEHPRPRKDALEYLEFEEEKTMSYEQFIESKTLSLPCKEGEQKTK